MKSQLPLTDGFKGVALAVLADCQSFLGTNSLEAARDNERLLSLVEHRGLGFLTLTLPAVGKIFDRALSEGRLPLVAEPGFGAKTKGSILPRFLESMWLRVFSEDGCLREVPDVMAIACLRQIFYCLKKARLDCDPERIAEVLNGFLSVDEDLREATLDWEDPLALHYNRVDVHLTDDARRQPGSVEIMDCDFADYGLTFSRVLDIVQFVCDHVSSSFGSFEPTEWKPKHGRGAVADAKLGKAFKYDFPTWPERLETIFPMADFGFANVGLWADSVHTGDFAFENLNIPGRLITVPKDMKGPRLIAAEPTSHQYCQQAILAYLVRAVHTGTLRSVINFSDQGPSRSMALEASRTQEFATIDLSHASDSVSCWLVERVFRRNKTLLSALMATRTSSVMFPNGDVCELRKFSTMGAATTFPVQTIFYAAVCIAAEMIVEIGAGNDVEYFSHLSNRSFSSRVFGDDIIVKSDAAKLVIQVLTHLGFKVNPTKTFTKGNFRESCGMDAYDGVDVTPTYVLDLYDKTRPTTLASVRESVNNLFLAGWWRTSEQLISTVPQDLRDQVPTVSSSSGCPGWASFMGGSHAHLKSRWNREYHRREYRMVDVSTSIKRRSPGGSASLLQYFLEAPDPDAQLLWSSGYDERPGLMVRSRWVVEGDLL